MDLLASGELHRRTRQLAQDGYTASTSSETTDE